MEKQVTNIALQCTTSRHIITIWKAIPMKRK